MSNQNSTASETHTPEILCEKYGIKTAAYYERLKFLGIKAEKDANKKAYLTNEQVALLDRLHEHILATGKMEGFSTNSEKGELAVTSAGIAVKDDTDSHSIMETEIPVIETDLKQVNSVNLEQLLREAAELKARGLVMPDLVKLHLASQMTVDDLPPDLKNQVEAVRSAANPKAKPAEVASSLLQQWRSNRSGN